MAIEIPDDWPAQSWVDRTPVAHLETISSEAASGVAPTRWKVASWESTREISSSTLPGQVRHKTGLSIGTAKALVKRESNDYPWKKGLVYDLSGLDAQIQLAPENATEIPTGQFRVAPISGTVSTLGVDVDLDEKTIDGRDKAANVRGPDVVATAQDGAVSFDPSWLVYQLAKQLGYGVGPIPGQDGYEPILDVPFQGSITPAWPTDIVHYALDEERYGEIDEGVIALSAPLSDQITARYNPERTLPASILITMDTQRSTSINFYNVEDVDGAVAVDLYSHYAALLPNEVQLVLRSRGANGVDNANSSVFIVIPEDPDRPHGIQIQLAFSASGGNWNQVQARARRGPATAWSAWLVHNMTNVLGPSDMTYFNYITAISNASTEGKTARFSMVDLNDTANTMTPDQLWTTTRGPAGRIYMEPLYGTSYSPWLDPNLSVWGAIQDIVDAWQGALITDVYGDLHLMNRFSLTGVGVSQIPIDVGLRFEDMPWAMDASDQADRLVLKYRPVTSTTEFNDWSQRIIVFEAQDVIILRPGVTDIFFSTEYLYPLKMNNLPFVRADETFHEFYHEWDAHRYNNGTGYRLTDGQLDFSLRQVTSSTWVVSVNNRTGQPAHLVDSGGQPYLKIRAVFYMTQLTESRAERGLSSTEARNGLEIDVSNYVQTVEDAEALADFIWGRVNQRAWKASTVNTVPDYQLDLGDVVALTHTRTGMRSNALVTKVALAGEPGSVTQKLDLVLIPPTWEDFDEAWGPNYHTSPPGSWTEFDSLWDEDFGPGYTWDDFDRTPTATTVAQIEEAM